MDWPSTHLCATGKNHCLNNTHCSVEDGAFCWFLLSEENIASITVKILHIGQRGLCLKGEFVSSHCLVDIIPWFYAVPESSLAQPPLPHKLQGGTTWEQAWWDHWTDCHKQSQQVFAPLGFRVSRYLSISVKTNHWWSKIKTGHLLYPKGQGWLLLRSSGGQDMHFSFQQKGEGTIAHFLYFQWCSIRLQGKLPDAFCRNVIADLFY